MIDFSLTQHDSVETLLSWARNEAIKNYVLHVEMLALELGVSFCQAKAIEGHK